MVMSLMFSKRTATRRLVCVQYLCCLLAYLVLVSALYIFGKMSRGPQTVIIHRAAIPGLISLYIAYSALPKIIASHRIYRTPKDLARYILHPLDMSYQQRSITSKNWRCSQAPTTSETSKVARNLQTLSMTDARRNRGSKFSGQLPTINEDDGFTTVTSKKPVNSATDLLAKMGATLPPTAAPYPEGRTFSRHGRGQVSDYKNSAASIIYNENARAGSNMSASPPKQNRYDGGSHATPNGPRTSAVVENVQKPQKLARHIFVPGTIIRCPLHEEDYMGTSRGADVTVASKFVSRSYAGSVFTKVRIMIVVSCHSSHYIAIPLFSHNGNGLSRKNPDEQMEYVSVKDHRIEGKFIGQSKHGILRTEYLKPGINILDPQSCAHITYTLPRKYDLPVVHHGHLTKQATDQLIQLYKRLALKELKM